MLLQRGQRRHSGTLRKFLYEAMAILNNHQLSLENLAGPLGQESLASSHLSIFFAPDEFQKEDFFSRNRWQNIQ